MSTALKNHMSIEYKHCAKKKKLSISTISVEVAAYYASGDFEYLCKREREEVLYFFSSFFSNSYGH